jgi:hypothetical protein
MLLPIFANLYVGEDTRLSAEILTRLGVVFINIVYVFFWEIFKILIACIVTWIPT